MQKVLITNDDGYKAAGIRAIIRELAKRYDTLCVAPAEQQSWGSKSVTRHRRLSLQAAEFAEFAGYTVDGTPADCAQIGLYNIDNQMPDFVVSGINVGSNLGYEQILSSGTVGAAMEAALQHVPAFASSVRLDRTAQAPIDFNDPAAIKHFAVAAEITAKIITQVLASGFPKDMHVISINMPWNVQPDAPWVITMPHTALHDKLFAADGDKFKHQGSSTLLENAGDDSDLAAIEQGYVSILPLNMQLTSHDNQQALAELLNIPIFKA